MVTDEWAGRRADARRNHERVLAAAVEVFTEHGLEATIPQVAARAGVGKATVYRSFPTKADLVHALAQVHVDWLKQLVAVAAAGAEDDARGALHTLLETVATRLAQDRLMVEVLDMDSMDDPEATAHLQQLLRLGREQGTLREDVTIVDLQVLLGGFAHSLLTLGVRDLAVWRRYVDLTLAALRP